jgi:hypothetical protein
MFRSKYLVMIGLRYENRAIFFIGSHPKYGIDSFGMKVVRFKNREKEYYADRIYRRIWTFKGLIKWCRLTGKDIRCLERKWFKWRRI